MLNDPLAAAMAKIMNAEKVGKREVVIRPTSSLLKRVFGLLQEHNYIGSFEEVVDGNVAVLRVNLLGNINKCGVIKPRFSTKRLEYEKWEKRYLPARDFGVIVVSTPHGVMTHIQAKEKNTGGKLLAFCY